MCLILHHFDMFQDLNVDGYWNIMRWLGEGYFSVDFFFILSGFVISYSYSDKIKQNQISSTTFFLNRIFKLWPVHLVTWIGAVFVYGGRDYFLSNLFSKHSLIGMLMLQSYIPDMGYSFWGNGLSWSVSTELFFYISFLLLVRLRVADRKGIFAFLTVIVLLNSIFVGNNLSCAAWFYYINPGFRVLDFIAGMLLYDWWKDTKFKPNGIVSASILEAVSISLLLMFAFFAATKMSHFNPRFQTYYYLFPCLILIYAFSFDMGIFSKLLSTKPFLYLGNCSFCIYMVHQIVLYIVKQKWGFAIVDGRSMLYYGAIGTFISIVASVILYHFVEVPSNRFLRNSWKKLLTYKGKNV